MISASCPACAAPLSFRHAAEASVVCEHCGAMVVRTSESLRSLGRLSSFERDLSPIQVGARGAWAGRSFEVVGGLRKGRARVRWNEWALLFEDGADAWLGEHNGNLVVYTPADAAGAPSPLELSPGQPVVVGGLTLTVAEVGAAEIFAAEGELPGAVRPGEAFRYADLHGDNGVDAGTLDLTDGELQVYLGKVVTLVELGMTGLRPFAGWSDPALVGFAGPEITSTRALDCPACGAAITLRAPGATPMICCGQCGQSSTLQEAGGQVVAEVLGAPTKIAWQPPIALGRRLLLKDVPYEVIGATRCSTPDAEEPSTRYYWVELLLHNPYRGFRWLTYDESDRLWRFVEVLPAALSVDPSPHRSWAGKQFTRGNHGEARIELVLGELTWEAHAGDLTRFVDYEAPFQILSMEESGGEITWSYARVVGTSELRDALEQKPSGPYTPPPSPLVRHNNGRWLLGSGLLSLLGGVGLLVMSAKLSHSQVVLQNTVTTTETLEHETLLTEPFVIPDEPRTTLMVRIRSEVPRSEGLTRLTLLHESSGTAWYLQTGATTGEAWVANVDPGSYRIYADVYKAPGVASPNHPIELTVERDPARSSMGCLLIAYAIYVLAVWSGFKVLFGLSRAVPS